MIWVVSALVVIAIGVVARAALRQQLNLDALPNAVGSTPATGLPEHPQPSDLDTIRFATALRGYDPLAVDRHLDAVRDAWAAGEDRPATPGDRVILACLEKLGCLEKNEIPTVLLQKGLKGFRAQFAEIGIGVAAIRQEDHLDIHVLLQHQIQTPHGCIDPGGISVIQDGQVGGEPLDQANLFRGQCGTG